MPAPIRSLIEHFPDELGLSGELPTEEPDDPYRGAPRSAARTTRGTDEVEIDGRRSRSSRAPRSSTRRRRPAATCPRSASTSGMAPFGACRVCMVGDRGRAGAPVAACTTPCRDGMQVATDDETARRSPRPPSSSCSRSCPSRPRRTPSSPQVARFLEIGEPRWQGEQRQPDTRPPPPLPGAPARALHLLRALRARLRRGPGRVRADGHRARLPHRHHRRPRLWLRATPPACPAGPAPTPARPTRSRSTLIELAAAYTEGEEEVSDERRASTRPRPRPAATAESAAGSRPTAPTGGSSRSAPRWTAPPTRATPA